MAGDQKNGIRLAQLAEILLLFPVWQAAPILKTKSSG